MTTSNHLKQEIAENPAGIEIAALPKSAVEDLQKLLVDMGYPLTVDGQLGPKTQAAWEGFKKSIYQGNPSLIGKGSYDALVIEAVERRHGMTPHDSPNSDGPARDRGTLAHLPGISAIVGANDPVYEGCNFTWGELTKGMSRIPVNSGITERLVNLARYLDKVRSYLGDRAITINSGYRDPITNHAVGGASSSRHMAGDAADIVVAGMSEVQVFNKLKSFHTSGGLAPGNGFVHLDMRPGAPVRWRYGNGPRIPLW